MAMNFNNIIFKPKPLGGFSSKTHFKNGYTLSVVCGAFAYCTPREDLDSPDKHSSFEIAIWDDKENWVTKRFFPDHHDDVVGWLSREEINDLMDRISNYEWDEDHALDQVLNNMVKDLDDEEV